MDTETTSKYVAEFWIDIIEVRVQDYIQCTNDGSCPAAVPNPEPEDCNWMFPGRDDHPMNCLDYVRMGAYCTSKGGRIPTQEEWEKAARGGCGLTGSPSCDAIDDYRIYPWGNNPPVPPDCTYLVYNNDPSPPIDKSQQGCGTGITWPVGSKPAGNSPYGLYDMAGNVTEVNTSTCPQTGSVMICGGHYAGPLVVSEIESCYCVGSFAQPYGIRGNGFRCAYDSKPSWAP
jgi:formylglycine-generating enzyme required for sulfatase activity